MSVVDLKATVVAKVAKMREERASSKTEGPWSTDVLNEDDERIADAMPLSDFDQSPIEVEVIMFGTAPGKTGKDGAFYRSALVESTINGVLMTGYVMLRYDGTGTVLSGEKKRPGVKAKGGVVVFARGEQYLHLTKDDKIVLKTAKKSTFLSNGVLEVF